MTTNFELTVRPFVARDIRPAKPAAVAPAADVPATVVLEFGATGAGRTFNGNSSFMHTKYQDKTPREQVGGQQLITIVFPPIVFSNGQLAG